MREVLLLAYKLRRFPRANSDAKPCHISHCSAHPLGMA
jgi:hypothetical protein